MSQSAMATEPKLLTEEEIKYVLDNITPPPGMGKTALALAHAENLRIFRQHLKKVKLVKKLGNLEKFSEMVTESVESAYVQPYTPVGLIAGQTIGEYNTQISLNTHRSAGQSSGTSRGFDRIRELLGGSSSLKNAGMMIYFKDPVKSKRSLQEVLHVGTRETIFSYRSTFEETRVSDLVLKNRDGGKVFRILDKQQIRDYDWSNFDRKTPSGLLPLVRQFALIYPEKFIDLEVNYPMNFVLELTLDSYRMFSHDITMADLARAIEKNSGTNADLVSCFWKSQNHGKMFLIIKESQNLGMDIYRSDRAPTVFFHKAILDKINDWLMKGIQGIKVIEPLFVSYSSIISEIEHIGDLTYVRTTHRLSRLVGPSILDLVTYLQRLGNTIIQRNPLEIVIPRNDNLKELMDSDPDNGFYFMKTYGLNFSKLIWNPLIDTFRLIPNNAHVVAAQVGISAANQFLINEYNQAFGSAINVASINPVHVQVQFDGLTIGGQVGKMSRTSMNSRGQGAITSATNSEAMKSIGDTANMGGEEKIVNLSASVFAGKVPGQIGTGATKVIRQYRETRTSSSSSPSANAMDTKIGTPVDGGGNSTETPKLTALQKLQMRAGQRSTATPATPATPATATPARPSRYELLFAKQAYYIFKMVTEIPKLYREYFDQKQMRMISNVLQQYYILRSAKLVEIPASITALNNFLLQNGIQLDINTLIDTGKTVSYVEPRVQKGMYGELPIDIPPTVESNPETLTAKVDADIARQILRMAMSDYSQKLPEKFLRMAEEYFPSVGFEAYGKQYTTMFPEMDPEAKGDPYNYNPADQSVWIVYPPTFNPYISVYLAKIFENLKQKQISYLLILPGELSNPQGLVASSSVSDVSLNNVRIAKLYLYYLSSDIVQIKNPGEILNKLANSFLPKTTLLPLIPDVPVLPIPFPPTGREVVMEEEYSAPVLGKDVTDASNIEFLLQNLSM